MRSFRPLVAEVSVDCPSELEFHAASMQVLDAGDGRSTLRWITDVKPDAAAEALGPLFEAELGTVGARLG